MFTELFNVNSNDDFCFAEKTNYQGPQFLLDLALSWNCVDGIHELFKRIRVFDDIIS
jgi:hypothetical protein